MDTTTISVDVAKSVFQLALANPVGRVVERKRLSRAQFQRFLAQQPQAEIIMEVCATSHHWAVKSVDHQALQGLYRIRSHSQETRRQRICLARALLAEFGVHLPTGAAGIVAKAHGRPRAGPSVAGRGALSGPGGNQRARRQNPPDRPGTRGAGQAR